MKQRKAHFWKDFVPRARSRAIKMDHDRSDEFLLMSIMRLEMLTALRSAPAPPPLSRMSVFAKSLPAWESCSCQAAAHLYEQNHLSLGGGAL